MESTNNIYHYVYKTTNLITKEYYYGRHSTRNLNDSYLGSGRNIFEQKKQYGRKNYKREFIVFCNSFEGLIKAEECIITNETLCDSLCLNKARGGPGGIIGHANYITKEGKKIYLKTNDPLVLLGKVVHIYTGRKDNEETKNKKRKAASGENNPMYGIVKENHVHFGKNFPEHSTRMSGEKNPMYGKSVYEVWLERYGEKEANKKYDEMIQKKKNKKWTDKERKEKSLQNRGEGNPRYINISDEIKNEMIYLKTNNLSISKIQKKIQEIYKITYSGAVINRVLKGFKNK